VTSIVATLVVLAAQVARSRYEEALLQSVFGDYDSAFQGVAHLIPGLY
jgi:protein-S-isoprenylcysteine O-methyltransferase Ste14